MINKNINVIAQEAVEKNICCSNKKCATRTELYVEQRLHLVNKEKMEYKCEYCDFIQKIIR